MSEPWTVAGIVRRHGARAPERPMITFGDRVITWGEMDRRSSQVAQGLLGEGLRPQERVALLDKNGPEYFEVLFGCGKINVVDVTVNWRLSPREIAQVVNDAEAKIFFVGVPFLPLLAEVEPALRTVKKIVVLGETDRHERYAAWTGAQSVEDPGWQSAPEDVAMLLYTSGTTGLPKGVMLTNTNLGTLVPQVSTFWAFDATSVNVVVMPLFHMAGSGWSLVGMYHGCHSILFREFVPSEILAAIERHRITNAFFVPAMLLALTQAATAAAHDYSSLRSIVYGASPITDEVLRRSIATFGCGFTQVYGLTETTGAITQLEPEDHDVTGPRARLLRSAGRPYPWVELRVVDPATGEDRPRGAVGEVWTRSVQNMKGYWNRADETEAAFAPGGWLRTGDGGFMDEDGYVFLTDRVKDMIVSGGENVYPVEVENVLAAHPGVADVAVIGVPDARWGETVKAVVVPRADTITAGELIAFSRTRLAHYKCPTSVDFVAALPRNPSGKVLKRELREPYWKGCERRIA